MKVFFGNVQGEIVDHFYEELLVRGLMFKMIGSSTMPLMEIVFILLVQGLKKLHVHKLIEQFKCIYLSDLVKRFVKDPFNIIMNQNLKVMLFSKAHMVLSNYLGTKL